MENPDLCSQKIWTVRMLLSSDKSLAIKTKTKGDNKNNFSGPSTINVKTKQNKKPQTNKKLVPSM